MRNHVQINSVFRCLFSLVFLLPPTLFSFGENQKSEPYGPSAFEKNTLQTIGQHSLVELRDFYKDLLFNKTMPQFTKEAVDRKYGGYWLTKGYKADTTIVDKGLYHQGRLLWLFSYWYNHYGKNKEHLEAARSGYHFLMKYGWKGDGDWFTSLSREGKVLEGYFDVYASVYMTLGLGEYFKATGDSAALKAARKTAIRITERITAANWQAEGHGFAAYDPGVKRLGTWLHFLSTLTPMQRYAPDANIDRMAYMCVRNMYDYHFLPSKKVLYEVVRADGTPYPDDGVEPDMQIAASWHGVQAGWMTMDEALRRGNTAMFEQGLAMGRATLETGWDTSGGCGLQSIYANNYRGMEKPDKTWGAMSDALIFSLMAVEHTHAAWAMRWFDRVYSCLYSRADVISNLNEVSQRRTLHQPREVMMCYEILDRMVKNGGKLSSFFDGDAPVQEAKR